VTARVRKENLLTLFFRGAALEVLTFRARPCDLVELPPGWGLGRNDVNVSSSPGSANEHAATRNPEQPDLVEFPYPVT